MSSSIVLVPSPVCSANICASPTASIMFSVIIFLSRQRSPNKSPYSITRYSPADLQQRGVLRFRPTLDNLSPHYSFDIPA